MANYVHPLPALSARWAPGVRGALKGVMDEFKARQLVRGGQGRTSLEVWEIVEESSLFTIALGILMIALGAWIGRAQ